MQKLYPRLIVILLILFALNVGVWIYTLIESQYYPVLLGLVTLAYGLGLRHGADADHIAAIDNTTRRLVQKGKQPLAVGFFFSLGHSTIVIILSLLLAYSSAFVKNNLPTWRETGTIIGTSVSSFFLLLIGVVNLISLIDMLKIWRKVVKGKKIKDFDKTVSLEEHLDKRGVINQLLLPFLKLVTNSWSMYFVGLLFGLGFDTASEVGILSISAASGVNNLSFFNILILPLAFTAGMTLVDTLDGILMLGAYGWANIKLVRKLYYNMNITFISVVIALFIGGVEAIGLIFHKQTDFGNLGYFIIVTFLVSWFVSFVVYKYKKHDLFDR